MNNNKTATCEKKISRPICYQNNSRFFPFKKFRLTCDPAAELLMNVLLGCAIQNVETCLQYKQTNKQILLQLLVLQRLSLIHI